MQKLGQTTLRKFSLRDTSCIKNIYPYVNYYKCDKEFVVDADFMQKLYASPYLE